MVDDDVVEDARRGAGIGKNVHDRSFVERAVRTLRKNAGQYADCKRNIFNAGQFATGDLASSALVWSMRLAGIRTINRRRAARI
jgi:hypothetical protein